VLEKKISNSEYHKKGTWAKDRDREDWTDIMSRKVKSTHETWKNEPHRTGNYTLAKNRSVSKAQLQIHDLMKEHFESTTMTEIVKIYDEGGKYLCWKNPDVYVPELNFVIEFDGSRYHEKHSKDIKRDKILLHQLKDFRILHYRDYNPTFSEIMTDYILMKECGYSTLYKGTHMYKEYLES